MSARFSTVLADDVVDLRYMVRLALEDSGHFEVVAEATNGLEAVQLAEIHRPDLMLLDISMPIQDGLESLPRIKEVSPDTTVVMLSGFEADRLEHTAVAAGARAYIEKGVPPSTLVDRLIGIMGGASSSPPPEPPSPAPEWRELSPDELLSFVAHEIRNPLSVIHGFGVTLEEQWERLDDARKRDVIKRMTANAAFLDAVLSNVMQMRSDHGGPIITKGDLVDPAELVESLAHDLAPMVAGASIETEVVEGLSPVRVDVYRLRQCVTNLVVNAVKFSPPGSPIKMKAGAHADGVLLEVLDRGPGIPRDKREQMFGRFVQLQPGGKGLGLGLYICRALMEAMGGRIWIGDSDEGTRVCLLLPSAPA